MKDQKRHSTDDLKNQALASLVPDEIIYNVNDYENRNYDACLLFGDVSGNNYISNNFGLWLAIVEFWFNENGV